MRDELERFGDEVPQPPIVVGETLFAAMRAVQSDDTLAAGRAAIRSSAAIRHRGPIIAPLSRIIVRSTLS